MLTEQHLNDALNTIVARYSGQHIGFPQSMDPGNVYFGECSAVVVRLFIELGIPVPSMFNARADGWGERFPSELAQYFVHEPYAYSKAYPRGTILMWNSPHIAIVLGSDGSNTVQVFEQNADPNGAACKVAMRVVNNQFHTCTWALIPIVKAPAPAIPYHIIPRDPFKMIIKAGSKKWDLGQPDFDNVNAKPILTIERDTDAVFSAELKHTHPSLSQYTYYLEDPAQPFGYNVADVKDWTPPPPPPPAPPAAPLTFPAVPTYLLLTRVPVYATPTNAQNQYKPTGTLEPGSYVVFSMEGGMKNLSSENNNKDPGQWVNPKDNVVVEVKTPPLPTPTPIPIPPIDPEPTTGSEANSAWKQYYRSHPTVEKYIAVRDYLVADINGNRPPLQLVRYDSSKSQTVGRVDVYGTFPGPDGTRYYRLKPANLPLEAAWYGVPILDPDGLPILTKQPVIRVAKAAPIAPRDIKPSHNLHLIAAHMQEGVSKFIDILPTWYKPNNKNKKG